jgi:hypothetical protein
LYRNQGKKMLEQYHNYSFHKAIERVYPEYEWYIWLFKNSSRNYWEHRENQQRYLDWLSSVLGVVTQQDWYTVLLEDVLENGGAMLCGKYGGSHGAALQALYPQYEWYPWLFTHSPSKFWSSWSNQRRYLNWVAEELGIETQHQWYSISNEDIISMQGTTLLGQHNSSMHRALQYVYPEYEWHGWFFEILPRNYWKDINNQRKFLDWIESEALIEHKEQWYTTDTNQLRTLGIHRLLCIYNNSLIDMLQAVYHEHTWYPWLFDRVPPRTHSILFITQIVTFVLFPSIYHSNISILHISYFSLRHIVQLIFIETNSNISILHISLYSLPPIVTYQ